MQSQVRFNRVSEKVWNALVQSQVKFNKFPEKVLENAESGQVQQGSGDVDTPCPVLQHGSPQFVCCGLLQTVWQVLAHSPAVPLKRSNYSLRKIIIHLSPFLVPLQVQEVVRVAVTLALRLLPQRLVSGLFSFTHSSLDRHNSFLGFLLTRTSQCFDTFPNFPFHR